jgi:hypothetical protein
MDTTNPAEKKTIIHEIVNHIVLKNGRFLKRIKNKDNTKQWVVLSTTKVHLKTAHAIQYRLRKKAIQNGMAQKLKMRTRDNIKDTVPMQFLSPRPRLCSSGDCQNTALECSNMCQYCHSLQAYCQWYLLAQQQQQLLWPNIVPQLLCRRDGDSGKDLNVSSSSTGHQTGLELQKDYATGSGGGHVSPEPSMDMPLEEDPLDKILSMRRNDSLISLALSDLSVVSSCLDDSASIATTILDFTDEVDDPDWLWSPLPLDFEGWTDNWIGQE